MKYILSYYKFIFSDKIKKYLIFASLLFLSFFITGGLFAQLNQEEAFSIFRAISENYQFAVDYNFTQLFYFILKNNITIALIAYISGLIFGLPTFFILLANSFIIGLIVRVADTEMNLFLVLASLIPHGIFEIPAILGALALGFFVGVSMFKFLFKGKKILGKLKYSLKYFIFFVFPFLVVAAFVESALISFFPN